MILAAKIIVFIYLIWVAIEDWKKQEISLGVSGVTAGLLLGIQIVEMVQGKEGGIYIFSGLVIGVFLLVVAWLSQGEIGMGDGVLFLVTGLLFGVIENCILLLISLMLTGTVGCLLILFRKLGRRGVLPFAPFVCVGYGVMLLWDFCG